jgi:hypothetical protein
VWLGITLANGESLYVRLANLGATGQLMVERAFADPAAAPANEVNSQVPPGKLSLELSYAERFLRITYNGTPFDRAFGLAAEPTGVYLQTEGDGRVEVHDLTLRRPSAK